MWNCSLWFLRINNENQLYIIEILLLYNIYIILYNIYIILYNIIIINIILYNSNYLEKHIII